MIESLERVGRNVTQNPWDPDQVFNDAQDVRGGVKEKKTFYSRMQAGRCDTSNMERIFNDWARLPYQQRLEVMNRLAGQVFKEDAGQ